jgi:hypothetical protein
MALVAALVGGLFVGLGLGQFFARARERRLSSRLARQERTLRERILPAVERYARRLEIPIRSVPPLELDSEGRIVHTGVDTVDHLAEICETITERETANSLALSDTVQFAQKDLGDVKKLRKA